MAILETCLTVLKIAETTTRLYDWFTGVSSGDTMNAKIKALSNNQANIIRLSDRLLYAPDFQQAINTEHFGRLSKPKEVHDLLNPISSAIDEDILASAVISTPEKLKKAFQKDPWELLLDIRPVSRTKKPANPDLVPISFLDGHTQYIGWQTKGALPILLNCDFKENGEIIIPDNTIINPVLKTAARRTDAFHIELTKKLSKLLLTNGLYLFPNIPTSRLNNFSKKCNIPNGEVFYAFIDTTLWRSGKRGMAFCLSGIFCRNDWAAGEHNGSYFIDYEQLKGLSFFKRKNNLVFSNGKELDCSGGALSVDTIILIMEKAKEIAKNHF